MTSTRTPGGPAAQPPCPPPWLGLGGALAALCFRRGKRGRRAAVELTRSFNDDVVDIGCQAWRGHAHAAAQRLLGGGRRRRRSCCGWPRLTLGPRYLWARPRTCRCGQPAAVAWSLATVHRWQDVDAGLRGAGSCPSAACWRSDPGGAGGDRPRQPRLDQAQAEQLSGPLPGHRLLDVEVSRRSAGGAGSSRSWPGQVRPGAGRAGDERRPSGS
jgi:hypothetical protein